MTAVRHKVGSGGGIDYSTSRIYSPSVRKASTAAASTTSGFNNSVTKFFWDFKGYSCYAEICKPITNNNNNSNLLESMSSLLPTISPSSTGKSNIKKPVVVLVHGFACSTVYWRETQKYLQNAGYTVHSVDLLGQGKSVKPGRTSSPTPTYYSIDLWGELVDEYSRRYIGKNDGGIVLVGNSLGSLVALSAATGDWTTSSSSSSSSSSSAAAAAAAFLPSNVRGLCFYNCGIGLNTRNFLKTVSQPWLKSLLTVVFDIFDRLIFDNKALLTYVIDNQVSEEVIKNALLSLYKYADIPESRVDDELVDSFISPVTKDTTDNVVEVIRQIYTNDPGKTPMEFHETYFMDKVNDRPMPIHVIWGNKDNVTPLSGPVGEFYSDLATTTSGDDAVDVSMQVIRAGHVPFDERPECNEGLIEWLNQISQPKMQKYQDTTSSKATTPSLRWPF
jgi:pimeloyl-ACP methyl ester carboxylesterase